MYGVRQIGKITAKSAGQVRTSRLGIGLEKLDRDLYDPRPCYDHLSQLGVKWVRIQSGWCRTEKEKGVYDFCWLDEIVDHLIARGLIPWMCLCYGNELYTPDANNAYGSVGRPPVRTEEEKQAWHRYVFACAKHFLGRVNHFEVWNEPDTVSCWRHGVSGTEYGQFTIQTATAVREGNPDAQIYAGATNRPELDFVYEMMTTGAGDHINAITYHRYRQSIEKGLTQYLEGLRGVLDLFNPAIQIIQGETGAQAAYGSRGAMKFGSWTDRKQAKFLLRKMMFDLSTEAVFTSYFTTVDMFENIRTDEGTRVKEFYGFFGVLGENFLPDGTPTGQYYPRPAYYAFQNLCSVMEGDPRKTPLPVSFFSDWTPLTGRGDEHAEEENGDVFHCGFTLHNGAKALAYWKTTDILTTELESSISMRVFGLGQDVRLIDFYDGSVYTIEPEHMEYTNGVLTLHHIPIRDYPFMLVFGDGEL